MTAGNKMAVAACIVAVFAATTAGAQEKDSRWDQLDPETQQRIMEEMEGKSPEEQEAIKRRMSERRSRYESMSEEEQAAAREKKQARRERRQEMSPEEREAAKQNFEEGRE